MYGKKQKLILGLIQKNQGCSPHDLAAQADMDVDHVYGAIYRLRKRCGVPIQMIDEKYYVSEDFRIPEKSKTPDQPKTKRELILEFILNSENQSAPITDIARHVDIGERAVSAHVSHLRKVGHAIIGKDNHYTYKAFLPSVKPNKSENNNTEPVERPKENKTLFLINTEMLREATPLLPNPIKEELTTILNKARAFNKLIPTLINAYKVING